MKGDFEESTDGTKPPGSKPANPVNIIDCDNYHSKEEDNYIGKYSPT